MLSNAVNQLCRQCRQQFISMPMRFPHTVVSRLSQTDGELRSWLLTTPVRFKGHSHWQNVKKTKMEKDDQRQRIISDVCRYIRNAVREGGTNPSTNSRLARALEMGKSRDVPNTTMTELLRKLEKAKDMKGSQLYVEARGLMNCQIIVEMYTDKPKRARQLVRGVLKKFGGATGDNGTAQPFFNYKGVVYVRNEEDKTLSKDEALEKAIEAGAEDVLDGLDDDDRPSYMFICDPKELHVVKKALGDTGLETGDARLEFVPHTFVVLEPEALDIIADMRQALVQLDEAVRVFDNVAAADPTT